MDPPDSPPERFVGLDVPKSYVLLAAVAIHQPIVVAPRRLSFDDFDAWSHKYLQPTDAVVLEATTNAWHRVEQLQPLAASVTVAPPLLVRLISSARVKTDARDSINLARLLAAGLIPSVWIPPTEVRELRALVAPRHRLIRQRTQTRHRLPSLLHRQKRVPRAGSIFAAENRVGWDALDLVPAERRRRRPDLIIRDSLGQLIGEVEHELSRLSTSEIWAEQAALLRQLPGMGLLNVLAVLAASGDITCFGSAKKLVGYAGLGASVHASVKTMRIGRITKQGRREMRAALVEAAWVAVERNPHWKATFRRLSERIGENKASVAIARKLLVGVWHIRTAHAADCHADVEAVARTCMTGGVRHPTARRAGLSRAAFVRQPLDRIHRGGELTTLDY
jgi:transposase